MMYKAFNTFIDDVFSFIMVMPTSHRIACLRDDLVFFICKDLDTLLARSHTARGRDGGWVSGE